jgi:hypothetical protein
MQIGAMVAQPAQRLVSGITLWASKPGNIVPTHMLIGPYRFRTASSITSITSIASMSSPQ